MFSEFKCGCIMSAFQGLVRVCEDHAPEKAKAPSGKEGRLLWRLSQEEVMTNKEVSNAARRIEFTPAWPEVYPEVAKGLTRIVNRQALRYELKGRTPFRRDNLRIVHGQTVPYGHSRKAPGHDAAVKAAKARKHDEYSVLGATDEQSWNNYLQDCRRRG